MLAIADVAVTVRDARKSAAWWQEKMGFGVYTIGPPGGHSLLVAPPGDRFVLHLCEGFGPVEPGNSGIAFVTDEIDRLVDRMLAAGVVFPEPLTPGSGARSAKFADPDGNVFWLLGAPRAFIQAHTRRKASGPAPRPGEATGRRRPRAVRRPLRPRR